jgi:hypothetical protein
MNNSSVQQMLGQNVVELTFVRRHEKLQWNDVRGLLGTTNYELLNGPFGNTVLHFRPPNGRGMGYDYKSKNLCVVWDFFRQEYRVFGAEQVKIRQLFDLSDPDKMQEFYDWFYEYIINMSNDQKNDFMGYEGEAYAMKQLSRRSPGNLINSSQSPDPKPVSKRVLSVYQNLKDFVLNFNKKKGNNS